MSGPTRGTKQVKIRISLECLEEMRAWCQANGVSLATAIEVAWVRTQTGVKR